MEEVIQQKMVIVSFLERQLEKQKEELMDLIHIRGIAATAAAAAVKQAAAVQPPAPAVQPPPLPQASQVLPPLSEDWTEDDEPLFALNGKPSKNPHIREGKYCPACRALPGELRDVLGDEWQVVENARRNNVLRDLARLNQIGQEVRQYGCKPDDRMWWRRVPSRKPVSKCHTCRRKYEPVPRDQEWGIGRFECVCGNKFKAFAMMDLSILEMGYTGKSRSLCLRCMLQLCEPIQILPPMRRRQDGRRQDGRRSRRYQHRCTAPNCFNRYDPDPRSNEPIIFVCVHPNSLREKVHGHGSDPHTSTGSTVATFLSQGDIDQQYEPSLADINEVHDAENENELDVILYQREPVGDA